MMFRQLKVGERLQPFTGTTGQGQAAMLVIAVVDHGRILRIFRKSSFGGFYASLLIRDIPCKELKQKIQSRQQGLDNHHDGRNDQKPDRIRSKYEMKQHNRQQREHEHRQQQAETPMEGFQQFGFDSTKP